MGVDREGVGRIQFLIGASEVLIVCTLILVFIRLLIQLR